MRVGQLNPLGLDDVEQLVPVNKLHPLLNRRDDPARQFLGAEDRLIQGPILLANPQTHGIAEILDAVERDRSDEVAGHRDSAADERFQRGGIEGGR